MQHMSNERLAELAASRAPADGSVVVGAPTDADAAADAHLAECPACRAELESLRSAADRLRADAIEPAPLPEGLWSRIAAEVAQDGAVSSAPGAVGSVAAEPVVADAHAATDETSPPMPAAASRGVGHVASRRARRIPSTRADLRRFTAGALVAACAVTALVVGGGVVLTGWLTSRDAPDTVVASAPLDALTDSVDPASATVVDRDGQRVLLIDTDGIPATDDAYLDVWLLESDVSGMVNLGVLDAGSGEYVLPDGVDLDRFPIVDVSVEPYDGDPTHSGDSVWRGDLAG